MQKLFFKRLSLYLLFITIPFALLAKVVSQHGSQDEVLFGRQLIQGANDDMPHGFHTFGFAENRLILLVPTSCII